MKRVLLSIVSYAILSFAVCFGISAFMGHAPTLLSEHRSLWTLCRGLLYFFRVLPAVLSTAYLISLSIHFGTDSSKAFTRFSPLIMRHFRNVMFIAIGLVGVMVLVSEVFTPMVQRKKNYLETEPLLLAEFIKTGNQCIQEEKYALAHRYGVQILKIKPNAPEGKELIDKSEAVLRAIKKISPATAEKSITVEETLHRAEAGNETVTSLLCKGKKAASEGRWFEAHYYAELAAVTGTEKDLNYGDAKRLASVAWNKLQDAPADSKTNDQILFAKKRKAYSALSKGDNIDAYYQFMEIAAEDVTWSSDPDVNQFLEIALKRVEGQYFFIDETEKLESFEDFRDVYFKITHDDKTTDVVYIRGITPVEDGGKMIQYLRGLYIITFAENGTLLKTMSVPYAKMLSVSVDSFDEDTMELKGIKKEFKQVPCIMLESIDRKYRGQRISPVFEYEKSYERNRSNLKGERSFDSNFEVLAMSVKDFNIACESCNTVDKMDLGVLLKTSEKASAFGHSSEVINAFLVKRINYPLIMMSFLLLLAAVAWNFRIGEGQLFKFIWIATVPVCTVIVDIVVQIILAAAGICYFALVAYTGNLALVVAVAVNMVLLFISAMIFALRHST